MLGWFKANKINIVYLFTISIFAALISTYLVELYDHQKSALILHKTSIDIRQSSNQYQTLIFSEGDFQEYKKRLKPYFSLSNFFTKTTDGWQSDRIRFEIFENQLHSLISKKQILVFDDLKKLLGSGIIALISVLILLYIRRKNGLSIKKELELYDAIKSLSMIEEGEMNLTESALEIFSSHLKTSQSHYWQLTGTEMKLKYSHFSVDQNESAKYAKKKIRLGVGSIGTAWLNRKSYLSKSKVLPNVYSLCIPVLQPENSIEGILEFHLSTIPKIDLDIFDQLGMHLGESISKYHTTLKLRKVNNLLVSQKQALDSAAIVAETDKMGRITYVNEKFIQISKYSKDELISQDHRILNSEYHPKGFFVDLWKTISMGNIWRGEVRNRSKDGSIYWVDTTIFPTKDENGRIQKYTAIRFDITDRKQTEEELKNANASIFNQKQALDSAAIVAETDTKGRITYVNLKFIEISGYSENHLLGQDHRILNSGYHDKSFFLDLWKTISKGNIWHGEVRNRKKNGKFYWVDTTIFPVKDKDGKLLKFVAIRFDITARKEVESELIIAREKTQKDVEMKAHFLATVSHEIRTPLNGIIGFSESLLTEDLPDKTAKSLKTIKQCGNTLYSLINDFLDYSKLEAGQVSIENINTDIRQIVSSVEEMFRLQVSEKRIEFECIVEDSVPDKFLSDPTRLQQILTNFVSNAIKFTNKGKVTVSVSSESLRKSSDCSRLKVEVRDTGIGVAKENIDRLFESFQQADKSTTRRFGGTGLGLSICKKIVHLMDGNISVSSIPEQGSVFGFDIVVYHSLPAQTELKDTFAEKPKAIQNLKVLIVDDNDINLDLIRSFFESLSVTPAEASNGEEAFEKCNNEIFDLIMIDLNMPVLDGWLATEKIRNLSRNKCSTIIALTAANLNDIKDRCMKVGFNEIMLKPIRKKMVYQLLQRTKTNPVNLPLFDATDLSGRYSDPSERIILKEVIENFFEARPSRIIGLRQVFQNKNFDKLKLAAHSLKGVVSSFSLQRSERILDDIENIDSEQEIVPAIKYWIDELEESLSKSENILTKFLTDTTAAEENKIKHVVIVDDCDQTLELFQDFLEDSGHKTTTFSNPVRAMDALKTDQPQLLIVDYAMPKLNGIELIEALRAESIYTGQVLMVTAKADEVKEKLSGSAYNFELLPKPIDFELVANKVSKYLAKN